MKKTEIGTIALLNISIVAYLIDIANRLMINIQNVLGKIKFSGELNNIDVINNSIFTLTVRINNETFKISNKLYIPIILLLIINSYALVKNNLKSRNEKEVKNNKSPDSEEK